MVFVNFSLSVNPRRLAGKVAVALFAVAVTACAKPPLAPLDTGYPDREVRLPRDLAAHEWAQTEWWYYTGHLKTEDGASYGFELTFFRRRTDRDKFKGVPLRWFARTGYMAHFAVVNEETGEYIHEGIYSLRNKDAYASTERYELRLKDWKASGDDKKQHISASVKRAAIDLELEPSKPAVLHGDEGIVPKGQGMANYYFSYTRLSVSGTLLYHGKKFKVDGTAWFDHEYGYMGSKPVGGWDWFSIQLDNDIEYMLYAIRLPDGSLADAGRACRINPDASEECVSLDEVEIRALGKWVSPHSGALYPSGWRIIIPEWDVDLVVVPTVAGQEFGYPGIAYWEGSCIVIGTPADGMGYVELVGYEPGGIAGTAK